MIYKRKFTYILITFITFTIIACSSAIVFQKGSHHHVYIDEVVRTEVDSVEIIDILDKDKSKDKPTTNIHITKKGDSIE